MSVIITLRIRGNGTELERLVGENPERMPSIAERAKKHGVIAHRFYGSDDGQIMVIDEWPDQQSFQDFFQETRSEIDPLMKDLGVTQQPDINVWHKLDTHDEIGWSD